MKPRSALLVPVVLLGLVTAGCGTASQPHRPRSQPDPAGPLSYVVTGATDHGEAHLLVPGTTVRIGLEPDGTFTMSAGCNSMSGQYTLDGTRLSVTDLATTAMGCPQPLAAQDAWLAGLFARPVRLDAGKDVTITAGEVVLALAPQGKAVADVPLQGTHWVLDTITTGDTANSVPTGIRTPTFQLNGRRIGAFDGCNGVGGTAVQKGSTLVARRVITTTMACSGTEQVQRTFSTVLQGRFTWSITGDRLTLTRGSAGLGFHAVRATR
ncbi:MAG: META domain-containing protein [Marmoricola sp.]